MKIASIFIKKKLDKNTDHFLDNSQIHYLKKVLKLKKDENVDIKRFCKKRNKSLVFFGRIC